MMSVRRLLRRLLLGRPCSQTPFVHRVARLGVERLEGREVPAITVTPTQNVSDMLSALLGNDISYSNASLVSTQTGSGATQRTATGTFTGGSEADLGFASGLIFSSGGVEQAPGSRTTSASTNFNASGDTDLAAAIPGTYYDATSLQFDFTAVGNKVRVNYFIASEEGFGGVADAFAFLVLDVTAGDTSFHNIALLPGTSTPVSVGTISASLNSQYYRNNNTDTLGVVYNGASTVLTAEETLIPGHVYRFKLVVADWGDRIVDTAVFVQAQSFTTVSGQDFGDAPGSYGTTLASDGARHNMGTLKLGSVIDAEADGPAGVQADGDDLNAGTDDEDGVVFLSPLVAGGTSAIQVTVTGAQIAVNAPSPSAYLNAWIDWNRDGDFTDTGEQILADAVFSGDGSRIFTFAVPTTAAVNSDTLTYARFRLSSTPGLLATGAAADGEVEDYAVALAAPPTVVHVGPGYVGTPGSDPDGTGPARWLGYDAFASIQQAITVVRGHGVIYLNSGAYYENVDAYYKPVILATHNFAQVVLAGNLRLNADDRLVSYLHNPAPGGYGFIAVKGAALIDGATLRLVVDPFLTLPRGGRIAVLGTNQLLGKWAGLPDDTGLMFQGKAYRVRYLYNAVFLERNLLPTVFTPLNLATAVNTPLNVPTILPSLFNPYRAALVTRLVSGPAQGQVNVTPTGAFSFTPPQGFAGRVSFTLAVFDGLEWSSLIPVTIEVR